MRIQESSEMYLETIYVLSQSNSRIRSIDVADKLSVSRPSVSRAIRVLESQGLIQLDDKAKITLTELGFTKASNLYDRHEVLTTMLQSFGIDRALAEEDACKMEHVVSDKVFDAIKKHFGKN